VEESNGQGPSEEKLAEIKSIHEGEWVSLREVVAPDMGINGYQYLHETRCNGSIVVVLPYRKTWGAPVQYLLRSEVTPCWDVSNQSLSGLTGGVDEGHTPLQTAKIELLEEAGYEAEEEDFITLGTCRGTKSTDTIYHIFAIDLSEVEKTGEAEGDGSQLEAEATCIWTEDYGDSDDSQLAMAILRLGLL
jgi:8-oxo-dGTP pyrophosphatase MutT (NUDIX family)